MQQRVGTCSLCGGDVVGYRGAWCSILPPPPDQCTLCGAIAAYCDGATSSTTEVPTSDLKMTSMTLNPPVKMRTTVDAMSLWLDTAGKWHRNELLQ